MHGFGVLQKKSHREFYNNSGPIFTMTEDLNLNLTNIYIKQRLSVQYGPIVRTLLTALSNVNMAQ
jgi:hypothetical protein